MNIEKIIDWLAVAASHPNNSADDETKIYELMEKLEGCVVVPVEPTDEMLIKGNLLALADKGYRYDAASIWETMVEAARGGK